MVYITRAIQACDYHACISETETEHASLCECTQQQVVCSNVANEPELFLLVAY